PGPANRNGILARRTAVVLGLTASPDPQVDEIYIERNGGTGDSWHRVAIVPNVTGNVTDNVLEVVAQAGEPLELKSYVPWPVTDIPRSGTCNVVGSRVVRVSGDSFNLNWAPGSEIIIAGNTYSLYAPPDTVD